MNASFIETPDEKKWNNVVVVVMEVGVCWNVSQSTMQFLCHHGAQRHRIKE
jgi:hypothetical protein